MSRTVPDSRLQGHGVRTADDLIVYEARVSAPDNQLRTETGARLLRYCIEHGHWSVFDQADMTVEVETSRAISAQAMRHWSFDFQEFSQRYADVQSGGFGFERVEPRRQDAKNRQASIDDLPEETRRWWREVEEETIRRAKETYRDALALGIARETARFILPLSVGTRYYQKGSARSWIHYLRGRSAASGAQPEHSEIAAAVLPLFRSVFPTTAEAAGL